MIEVNRHINSLDFADKIMELWQKAEKEKRQDILDVISRYVIPALEETPTADVHYVRRGHWNIRADRREEYNNEMIEFFLECSECGRRVSLRNESPTEYMQLCAKYPYCHCGAFMDPAEK